MRDCSTHQVTQIDGRAPAVFPEGGARLWVYASNVLQPEDHLDDCIARKIEAMGLVTEPQGVKVRRKELMKPAMRKQCAQDIWKKHVRPKPKAAATKKRKVYYCEHCKKVVKAVRAEAESANPQPAQVS